MKDLEIFTKAWFWVGLLLVLAVGIIWQRPDDRLHLYFCDVGQGDAALITYHSTQILVDGGPDTRVLVCLEGAMPFWDRQIEMVVNTHPEKDHLTGLIDVMDRYRVTSLFLNPHEQQTALYNNFLEAVKKEGAAVRFPSAGDKVRLAGMELNFIWPTDQPQILGVTTGVSDVNETSIVTELSFGNFKALLTGDISRKIEDNLELTDVEVLKVGHHGSRFSTGENILKKTTPELAVISVGPNSYGHPTEEVLKRLSDGTIRTLRTDKEGTIEIVTDGNEWGLSN